MGHGGGQTWITGTYDPELNLLYWGTGNPNPVHAGAGRKGDNLWTCSIVALNPDNGKLVWYYQVSPHDTHDWDAVQTPILFDGEFQGKQRKLIAQASRNGYFFLLDRTNGEHLLTAPFIDLNWSLGLNEKGQPIPDPKKEPSRDGTLVAPSSNGATNWFAPTFSPETGLFYMTASQNYSVFYLTAEGKAEGFAGRDDFLTFSGTVKAVDYQTGKIRWSHDIGGMGSGLLSTAGGLLFVGDSSKHLIAYGCARRQDLVARHHERQRNEWRYHVRIGWEAIYSGGRRRFVKRLRPTGKVVKHATLVGEASILCAA